MNAQDDVVPASGAGWFVSAASVVGDLGNPFYREERQRDVWNEAAAVGLQVMVWLGLAAATAMVWLGGATAVPYAITVIGVLGVASWVAIGYARALGVDATDGTRTVRLRMLPYGVLLVAFLLGVQRSAPADGSAAGFATGAVVGGLAVLAWLAWTGLRARRVEQG